MTIGRKEKEMGNELTVRQEIDKVSEVLKNLQGVANALKFQAESLTIVDEKDVDIGRKILQQLNAVKKEISGYVKPVKKAFDAFIKEFSVGAEEADKVLRKKLADYANEQERIRREKEAELRRLQEEEQQRRMKEHPEEPAPEPVPIHVESPVSTGFQTRWHWKVIDEAKIPEKYWTRVLNEKLISFEVTDQKEKFNVPGIEAYSEKVPIASR
jgi:hypothetical protein